MKSTNNTAVTHGVPAQARWNKNGHKGGVLWFTGLSGSGKSTLSMALESILFAKNYEVFTLDGDNLRLGLNANLDFSIEDRSESIRRAGEVAALFAHSGMIVLVALISPYAKSRNQIRKIFGDQFHEIYLDPGLDVCEARDPKGLYKKARAGEILNFTGLSSPYEAPINPELRLDTSKQTVEDSLSLLTKYVDDVFRAA
jgi:bifunctional enzyme CysN/CysC